MGREDLLRIIKNILLKNVKDIIPSSIIYEDINYEASSILFETKTKLYEMDIEFSSGINIHLRSQQGFLRNGEKLFLTDTVMSKETHKQIRRIKIRTIFNYNLRMQKIVLYLCDCINKSNN